MQNVTAAVLGEGIYLPRLIRSILQKEILPARNLSINSKNTAAREAAEGYAVSLCADEVTAALKGEIILVCASYQMLPSVLAPISRVTGQNVLVTVCDDTRVNLDYVRERVANGTELITATLWKREDGGLSATYEIAQGVRLYLHQLCRDLVNAMCEG